MVCGSFCTATVYLITTVTVNTKGCVWDNQPINTLSLSIDDSIVTGCCCVMFPGISYPLSSIWLNSWVFFICMFNRYQFKTNQLPHTHCFYNLAKIFASSQMNQWNCLAKWPNGKMSTITTIRHATGRNRLKSVQTADRFGNNTPGAEQLFANRRWQNRRPKVSTL